MGPATAIITLTGTLLTEFIGDRLKLDDIREMADQRKARPLMEGIGRQYGL
ncbi:phage tail protein [Salinicola halophyticus]|uniref:phage tail protein n=1 Tax=Salinicola halophyticus TaxID=1808881 RepID=UPI003F4727DE